ncbi:hypothetical protein ACFQ1L_29310 [Phytohabitans flavus]|uniref:hypothetical protein n=1 Tax=Phytohabitans flavus TaxID=1076124 RepID=UPI003628A369
MKLKSFIGAAGVCALVASLMVGVAGPAAADPSGPSSPINIDGSGGPTTQDVMNALASQIGFSSWDATAPSSLITPKIAIASPATVPCGTIARPRTDFDGVVALRRSLSGLPTTLPPPLPANYRNTTATYNNGIANPPFNSRCFEYSRSASGPGLNASPTGLLQYVPFGIDGLTVAVGPASGANATLITGTFTLPQLQTMYSTGAPVVASNGVSYDPVDAHNPADLPAPGSTAIHLLLPPPGSATRTRFANVLGFNPFVLPPWVKDTYGAGLSVPENDGSAVAADRNAIMPYSIAQWLAQQGRAGTPIDRRNGARLQSIGGISPLAPNGVHLNPNWHSILVREVFNVIPFAATTAGPGTGYLNDLWEIFVDTSNTPFSLCRRTSMITSWGFGLLPTGRCGKATDPALRAFGDSQW